MKHYVISQSSLRTAHRNPDSELVGRIYNSQEQMGSDGYKLLTAIREKGNGGQSLPTNNPSHTPDTNPQIKPTQVQIYNFYERYGFDWRSR